MKILFVQNGLLFPTNTGGRIRTLNVVRYLAQWHEVTYVCNVDPTETRGIAPMRELGLQVEVVPRKPIHRNSLRFWWRLAANLFSGNPLRISKHYDPRLRRRVFELVRAGSFDLVICDFLHTAKHVEGLTGIPKVLFQHNVEAEIFRRHAENDAGRLRRAYMRRQYRRMARFESAAGRNFDSVIAVSERDKQIFQSQYAWSHVRTIDTSVDLDFFTPGAGPADPDRCLFVGSLDWMPNQDGLAFFVREVWPRIRRQRPRARFHIVGRNPSKGVLRLAEEPGVQVVGTVPDTRPHLQQAGVVVVPVLVGGGTRLKIFEAMAMGKAVVSTTLGAEGLPVTDGRDILIADEPDAMAAAVVGLMNSPDAGRRIGDAALALVRERFGAQTIARQFEKICLEPVGHPSAQLVAV